MATTDPANVLIRAFEATSFGVMITDAEATILAVNDAFTEVTGWAREEVIGRTPRLLSSGRQDADFYETMWASLKAEGHWRGEVWNRRKGGAIFPEHLTIDAMRDDDGTGAHYVGIFSSIEERRQCEASVRDLAFNDPVTGLPNRELCADRLERAVALARRRVGQMAVQLIDLDAFRKVNDTLGHDCGDLVLKAAGERLRACLREEFTDVWCYDLRGRGGSSDEDDATRDIVVAVMVRNPKKAGHTVHYTRVGRRYGGRDKLDHIRKAGSIAGVSGWRVVPDSSRHRWVRQRDI